jgi:hypothetical protein
MNAQVQFCTECSVDWDEQKVGRQCDYNATLAVATEASYQKKKNTCGGVEHVLLRATEWKASLDHILSKFNTHDLF